MKQKLELRMYGLVPYNISPIQQAIQYGHAVVEYGQMVKMPQSLSKMQVVFMMIGRITGKLLLS